MSDQVLTITGVEVPFSVDMVLEETGEVLPCKLAGIFDLIESDEEGNFIIVELKTGAKRFTDDQIDLDLQGTLYSYALRQMGYQTDGEETLVRYDQLPKLKNPDMETYFAVRGNIHYAWAYNLVRKVLKAVNNEIFFPIPGWQCKDCQFGKNVSARAVNTTHLNQLRRDYHMSIIFELYKTSGKKVCPPNYVRKSNCPLIVRTTSEDLLTANVFGILKNLDPKIWLRRFLGEAIKGKDFSRHTFDGLSYEFWKRYRPPLNRKYREGLSEVDVTISYKEGIIFIEAKYLAPVSLRTSSDPRRDQIIRYLDLAAYHYLNHPDSVKEFYFVLIIDTDKPPWILTRYRYNQNLTKGLTNPGLFKPPLDTSRVLSRGIGWLTWKQLRKILEITKGQFRTEAERKFVDDLIVYLDYKIREGERIRTERKQLSFW